MKNIYFFLSLLFLSASTVIFSSCGDGGGGGGGPAASPGDGGQAKTLTKPEIEQALIDGGYALAPAAVFWKIDSNEAKIHSYIASGGCSGFAGPSGAAIVVCDDKDIRIDRDSTYDSTADYQPTSLKTADLRSMHGNDSKVVQIIAAHGMTQSGLGNAISNADNGIYEEVLSEPFVLYFDGAGGNFYERTDRHLGKTTKEIPVFGPGKGGDLAAYEMGSDTATGLTLPVQYSGNKLIIDPKDKNRAPATNLSGSNRTVVFRIGGREVGIAHKGRMSDGVYAPDGGGVTESDPINNPGIYDNYTPFTWR